MLIQNTSNMAQAALPARLAGNGAPDAAPPAPPDAGAKPAALPELPDTAVKQAAQATEQRPSAAQLQNVVDGINKALKQSNKNLEFSVDADTKKSIVKVVDTETGDLIRQFPSEEALAISRAIDQMQQGLLLKQKA